MVRRAAHVLLIAAALGALFGAGCGKKGPPLPPLRSHPERVERLSSRQIGERIVLSFPQPSARTDGEPLGPDAGIEILMTAREPAPRRAVEIEMNPEVTWSIPRSEWSAYAQGRRLEVGIRLSRVASALAQSPGGAAPGGRRLSFIVQVVEAGKRRSVASDIETFVVCDPPPAPVLPSARVAEQGLWLSWSSGAAAPGARFNIYRHEDPGARPEAPLHTSPPDDVSWLDETAVPGKPYRYTLRAASAERCESADAVAAPATRVDLFPPGPPQGLAAVAQSGTIRLFWRPNREADLRGYRVYRAAGPSAPWKLLTPQDLTSTSYTDEDVAPGVVYSYAITARDGASPPNESSYSEPAIEKTESGK